MLEIFTVLIALFLDQLVKHLAVIRLPLYPGMSYPLWNGVFHFTYTENTGAAFGILKDQLLLFYLLTSLVCAGIAAYLIRYHKTLERRARFAIALILGGAAGNLLDRLILGYVRDMFDFRLIQFAVFNVADICVTAGTALLVLFVLFGKTNLPLLGDRPKKSPPSDVPEASPHGE